MTGDGGLVEVQATAERTPLSRAHLDDLLALAEDGHRGAARAPGRRRAERDAAGPRHPQRAQAARVRPAAAGDVARAAARRASSCRPRPATTFAENALIKARAAARRDRRAPRSPTTRASRPRRSAAPRASAPRATPGETRRDAREPRQAARRGAGRAARLRYVCAIAYVDADGDEHALRGRCEGTMADGAARRRAASATTRVFVPDDGDGGRTMAELDRRREGRDLAPRARRAGAAAAWLRRVTAATARTTARPARAARAAALSIASNSALIVLKIVAGASPARSRSSPRRSTPRSTCSPRSSRSSPSARPRRRPTPSHRYGHEKFENVAAGIEGDADPRRLRRDRLHRGQPPRRGHRDRVARLRHRRRRVRHRVNLVVSQYLYRRAAARPTRPPWPATPPTCAPTPTRRSACSSASRWSASPARPGSTRSSRC